MSDEQILELINRRQRQILVHSCLYYRMNITMIDDHQFDYWSKELVRFMEVYPILAEESLYYQEFKMFDGSSGYDLPYWRTEILGIANKLTTIPTTQTKGV